MACAKFPTLHIGARALPQSLVVCCIRTLGLVHNQTALLQVHCVSGLHVRDDDHDARVSVMAKALWLTAPVRSNFCSPVQPDKGQRNKCHGIQKATTVCAEHLLNMGLLTNASRCSYIIGSNLSGLHEQRKKEAPFCL